MTETVEMGTNGSGTRPITADDHWLAVMGPSGDVKTIWNKNSTVEVDNARQTFDSMKAKGYVAFRVIGKEGDKGEQMKEFDPNAERMIMVPPLAGG